jgi:hypothetical protein
VLVDDIGNHMTYPNNLYGIAPNYFDTAETRFMTSYLLSPGDTRATAEELLFGHPNQSELSLGDQLYTPRGSQGAGSMLYFLTRYALMNELGTDHIDNDEYGQILFRMKMVEEMETNIHFMRNVWYLDGVPGFNMVAAAGRREKRLDMIISLPMYAKYARLRLKQIPMERLLIKLKEPNNREHIKFLKDAISNTLDRVGMKDKYSVWSHKDLQDITLEAEFTLETIFNVVIVITMFICFFSLSSSMSGNLYEQCKDIAVMRSIGFTKNIITKLYIYEAFILVVASSISGVGIGAIAGYSISF